MTLIVRTLMPRRGHGPDGLLLAARPTAFPRKRASALDSAGRPIMPLGACELPEVVRVADLLSAVVADVRHGGALNCRGLRAGRGYRVICRVVRVWPADLSRPASAVPIAVAGVRTPARSGSWSRSSARHSAVSPSITQVAAYPGSPRAPIVARYRAPAEVWVWICRRKKPARRARWAGPRPGAGRSGPSIARGGPDGSPAAA